MTEIYLPSYQFSSPSTILISGSTGSGKTTFIKKVLEEKKTIFQIEPTRIIYFYSIWQDIYEQMEEVEFYSGLPSNLDEFFIKKEKKEHILILFDDLMEAIVGNKNVQNLY